MLDLLVINDMKKIWFLIFILIFLYLCEYKNGQHIHSKGNCFTQCAITNNELIAWIYKNRMINEKMNNYPDNKVSVLIFSDQTKSTPPHFLKGLIKSNTIIDISVFNEFQKKNIGYLGITCILDDTIMVFDNYDIGGKYYNKQLLQNFPIDNIKVSTGHYFAVYNLYTENGRLHLWDK
jgi:hypothetical protein